MKKRMLRDALIAGLTLFAMFLGAGNIIFPPYVGVQAGTRWPLVAMGFLFTAAGLPMLGALTVAKLGGDPNRLCERAWPWMSKVLAAVIIIMIGPLFAIPRTAATTFELSVLPFLDEGPNVRTVFLIASAAFFLLTLLLSLAESRVMSTIGGILSPILVLLLATSIILSVIRPMGTPEAPRIQGAFFYHGFSAGYQTMDGLGSLVMSGAIASMLLKRGYSQRESSRIFLPTALLAGLLLGAVYLGYVWIGASAGKTLAAFSDRTAMLSQAATMLAGDAGRITLGLIIFFACLTTSSGLVVTFADYFHSLFRGKVSYKALAVFCTLVSFGISQLGVEGIISLAEPVLCVIYPICIVLILLNLFSRFIPHDAAFRGALAGTMLVSLLLLLQYIPPTKPLADTLLAHLPLGTTGFAYALPAAMGYMLGHVGASMRARLA